MSPRTDRDIRATLDRYRLPQVVPASGTAALRDLQRRGLLSIRPKSRDEAIVTLTDAGLALLVKLEREARR